MTLQRYDIHPHQVRDAIEEIQSDTDSVLVVSGPTCSGQTTLCSALRRVFEADAQRIFHSGVPVPTDRRVIALTVPGSLRAPLLGSGDVIAVAVSEIRAIVDGTSITHSLFHDEPPWLNDAPPWHTNSPAMPSKAAREAVKAILMLQRRGSLSIGPDMSMLLCARVYRASIE